MPKHEEYLRRNLVLCSSIGARANIRAIRERLARTKRPPKWLMEILERTYTRASEVQDDLAAWRNAAPDAPDYVVSPSRRAARRAP